MKILITGFPGTGKSTIARTLKKRGYHAYDPERMHAFMHLENRITGKHIKRPPNTPRGWYDTEGAFNWNIPAVTKLLESYEEIYICSLADNMQSLYSDFDFIFILTADDFLLQQRLEKRNSGLSTTPSQMADILTLHRHFEQSLIEQGAYQLDVKKSVEQLVTTILEIVHEDHS